MKFVAGVRHIQMIESIHILVSAVCAFREVPTSGDSHIHGDGAPTPVVDANSVATAKLSQIDFKILLKFQYYMKLRGGVGLATNRHTHNTRMLVRMSMAKRSVVGSVLSPSTSYAHHTALHLPCLPCLHFTPLPMSQS